MAALSDPHTFLVAEENHVEPMKDNGIVEPDIRDVSSANGKAAESKGAGSTKRSKMKKEDDNRDDLMAALSDPRSYFATQVKRSQKEKDMANDESDMKNVPANGRQAESAKAANGTKKSSKAKREAENREDFLAALSDRRTYFAAQVKHEEQKKAMGIVDPGIQQAEGAGAVKKRSRSKKETQNVCIII